MENLKHEKTAQAILESCKESYLLYTKNFANNSAREVFLNKFLVLKNILIEVIKWDSDELQQVLENHVLTSI